jgi:hypothetical protein
MGIIPYPSGKIYMAKMEMHVSSKTQVIFNTSIRCNTQKAKSMEESSSSKANDVLSAGENAFYGTQRLTRGMKKEVRILEIGG